MAKFQAKTNGNDETSQQERIVEVNGDEPKTNGKKTREAAAFSITYDDGEKSGLTRIMPKTKAVVVTTKDKAYKIFTFADLNQDQLVNLAIFGFAKRAHTYVNNHSKGPDDILALAQKHYDELASGQYYVKPERKPKEPKGRNDQAEVDLFVDALCAALKDQKAAGVKTKSGGPIVLPNEQQREGLKVKWLVTKTRKEFLAELKDRKANATFLKHWTVLMVKGMPKTQDALEDVI